jgi:hypothetical protein
MVERLQHRCHAAVSHSPRALPFVFDRSLPHDMPAAASPHPRLFVCHLSHLMQPPGVLLLTQSGLDLPNLAELAAHSTG